MKSHIRMVLRLLVLVSLLLSLTGCVMKLEPLTPEQLQESAENDLAVMFNPGKPLSGPLTESEVIARVLKFNLDRRVKLMEEALALNQTNIDRWDLLPKLAANAGFSSRSEFYATSSRDLFEPNEIEPPSYSSERDQFTADLGLSWNILDFGVSYFNAKQNADLALIAGERRRKAIHNLIQEVRFVFWRAAAYQMLKDDVDRAVERARGALDNAKIIEQENLKAPFQTLQYRKRLLDALYHLSAIQQQLSTAEIELAALINVPPGTSIVLEVPEILAIPAWEMELEQMENLAFANNPELREQEYQSRITVNETRKAIAGMFPGITLDAGYNYDSNDFLVDNEWYEAGIRLSWNLINLIRASDVLKHAKNREKMVETRRLAIRMALLAQVHMAERQFRNITNQYRQVDEMWQVDNRLYELSMARSKSEAQGMLQSIAASTANITSQLRRYEMYAQVEAAFARIQATIGEDLLTDMASSNDIETLSAIVEERLTKWREGNSKTLGVSCTGPLCNLGDDRNI